MKRTWTAMWTAVVLTTVGAVTVWGQPGPPPPAVPADEQPAPETQPGERGIVLDMPEGLAPALEEFPGLGQVDWSTGVVVAVGEAEIKPPVRPRAKMVAMRLARIRAYANAVRLCAQLRVDSDQELQLLANKHRQIDIKGFVQGFQLESNEMVQAAGKSYYRATLRVPFYGVKGLSVTIYEFLTDRELAPRLRQQPWRRPESDLPPHLLPPIVVIDATGLGAQAAVYPKVQDNLGNALLSLATRDQAVAVNEGVATYAYPAKAATQPGEPEAATGPSDWLARLRATGRRVVVLRTVAEAAPTAAGIVVPGLVGMLSPEEEGDEPEPRRRRRVRVKGSAVAGDAKTNIVLDKESAEKLASDPETAEALKSGKVYIVIDARKAAVEGRLLPGTAPVLLAKIESAAR